MSKIEHIITGLDGSEVKLIAQDLFGQGGHRSVDVYALRRQTPSEPWVMINDRPHPDWRAMSVDQYIQEGRSELLRVVGASKILTIISELNAASAEQARIDHEREASLNEQLTRDRMRQAA